mmetsp:Transcript_2841/g.5409  ORF Transcript_2841/g.5409 Transcript_2841/m.5409 type:complete len:90 (+) Transcript_2841:122-391(+)
MIIISIKLLIQINMGYVSELNTFIRKNINKITDENIIKYKYNNTKIFIYKYNNILKIKKLLNKFIYQKALYFISSEIYKRTMLIDNKKD